jgi:hypothetical protein
MAKETNNYEGIDEGVDELEDALKTTTNDTSRNAISGIMSENLWECSVCEFAFESRGLLKEHVQQKHAEDLKQLRRKIHKLEVIPRDDLTPTQVHNLIVLRRSNLNIIRKRGQEGENNVQII